MKKKLLAILCIFFLLNSYAQIDLPFNEAMAKFLKFGLDKTYQIDNYLKPTTLQADFNGDKKIDIVFIIFDKTSKKKGILILHAGSDSYFILGAGKAFNEVGDDFTWTSKWSIYRKSSARQTLFDQKTGDIIGGKKIKLTHPGIQILDEGNDGCIIYWDGQKYISIHQGS